MCHWDNFLPYFHRILGLNIVIFSKISSYWLIDFLCLTPLLNYLPFLGNQILFVNDARVSTENLVIMTFDRRIGNPSQLRLETVVSLFCLTNTFATLLSKTTELSDFLFGQLLYSDVLQCVLQSNKTVSVIN